MGDFSIFRWARGVLFEGNEIKRVAAATIIVFGGIYALNGMGFKGMMLLAVIVAMGVLLAREGYGTPFNLGENIGARLAR